MTSVVFIPLGGEIKDSASAGIVKSIGDDNVSVMNIQQDNHQKSFIVKNNDGSLEIFNVMKRTTADLVLPDNRMSTITIVNSHKIFDHIPLDNFGLQVIISSELSILDSIEDIIRTMDSVKHDGEYQYILLDEENKPKSSVKRIKLNLPESFKINGMTLLQEVQKKEIKDNDIRDIKTGYITCLNPSMFKEEWLTHSIVITNKTEEERPIRITSLTQSNQEDAGARTEEPDMESN